MENWKTELAGCITQAEEISPLLGLSAAEKARMEQILQRFPMSVTPYYLSLADLSSPDDPIMKMCIPSINEMDLEGAFDTSGEADNTILEGLQHKYSTTAMVLTTQRCAMYCRHCFRKRLVGQTDEEIARQFGDIIAYIEAHPEVNNVLLTGGDCLMLPNNKLESYLEKLSGLPQLDFIRLASRMPVVLPSRIYGDSELLDMLKHYSSIKRLYVVTQFNHPRELTNEAEHAIACLQKIGIVIKNQTVLLGGVNDDPSVLGELLRRLTVTGVVPYYIFQCRPVSGVKSQFQIPIKRGAEIVETAKAMQNGQGKCVKYCMSHPHGKIEILGALPGGEMAFKFHQAKYERDNGRIFSMSLRDNQGWLGELENPKNSIMI